MLEELLERRNAVIAEMRQIHNNPQGENGDLTEEQESRFNALREEKKSLDLRIRREQELQALEDEMRQSVDTGSSEAANALEPSEVRNETNNVSTGTSEGEQTRVTDVREQAWRSLGDFLCAVRMATSPSGGNPAVERLYKADTELRAALGSSGTGVDSAGFLVQPTFVNDLLGDLFDTGVLLSRTKELRVGANSNKITWNGPDQSSRVNDNLFGGIIAAWTAEAGTLSASKPKLKENSLSLEKLTMLYYATDEILEDAPALESSVRLWFPEAAEAKYDRAIIRGTGAGMPTGFLSSGALVTVAKEKNQPANTFTYENAVKMYSRMLSKSLGSAVWLANQDVFPQLYTMTLVVGTGGAPVYLPAGGASASPFATLMGRPVIPVEECSTLGTVGDILFVDLSRYIRLEKSGIQAASSIHVQFVTSETAFRWVWRTNGRPILDKPITPAQGSNTLSDHIALATRS